MGKFEQEDSKKVLAGKPILRGTSQPRSLWEFLKEYFLYPYRTHKQKQKREEFRKSLFKGE